MSGFQSKRMMVMDKLDVKQYDERHGGPYDRGGADAYYRRDFNPHYYKGDSYNSARVNKEQMSEEQIEAYTAGYRETVDAGCFKDWG